MIRIVVLELDVLAEESHGSVSEEELSTARVSAAESASHRGIAIRLQHGVVDLHVEDCKILTSSPDPVPV